MSAQGNKSNLFASQFLSKWASVLGVNIADLKGLKPTIRSTVSRILGMVAWQTHLHRTGVPSPVYQDELIVEVLLSLQMATIGHYKTAYILLRSAIENTFKLVYYKDHPVELRLALSNPEERLPTKALYDYCMRLDELESLNKALNPCGKLYGDFAELSRFVHSQSPLYFHDVAVMEDLRFDAEKHRTYTSVCNRVVESIVVLLTAVHRKMFSDLNVPEQTALLASLRAATRSNLRQALSI